GDAAEAEAGVAEELAAGGQEVVLGSGVHAGLSPLPCNQGRGRVRGVARPARVSDGPQASRGRPLTLPSPPSTGERVFNSSSPSRPSSGSCSPSAYTPPVPPAAG